MLVLLTTSCIFASSNKIIKRIYVTDSSDIKSKNIDDDPDILRLKTVINKKNEIDINQWIRENFLVTLTSFHKIPLENNHFELVDGIDHPDGIYFKSGSNKLHYWKEACKVFDCYKPYLSLVNASGEVVWKRRVPFLEVPVYPFVYGHFILYIGFEGEENFLVIINLSNGKVIEKHTLMSDDNVRFSLLNPVNTFPVCINGKIVIQGCVVHYPRMDSKDLITYSPSDFIVLEMDAADVE
jgi:hypothetical protein